MVCFFLHSVYIELLILVSDIYYNYMYIFHSYTHTKNSCMKKYAYIVFVFEKD